LVHLPTFIRRFGPAIAFSTERYESFNSVFRLSSIYSNRQSPSRDTCHTFASQDIVKHLVTGGFWFDLIEKKWVCAGNGIHALMNQNPVHARSLAVPHNEDDKPAGKHMYVFCCMSIFQTILPRISYAAEQEKSAR
jgi:hypothetical protein